jgi:serine/threonine protein kinase
MDFLKEYTLLGELGKGGFAKVYKVRHNTLDYIRAIRVLNETVTDEGSKTYQNFLRECKVLLRLGNGSHRNIVHIYQPRLLDNHALVEMDFVDGKDLSNYLKDNGNFLPIDEVLRMVEQISSALAYCHEDIYKFCMDREVDNLKDDPMDGSRVLIDEETRHRLIEKYKVIHNDIHSGNIMRREDGSFVLLDFGLAITGSDDVCKTSRHENGAVEYKAPEKWDKNAVLTEQCDVYGFGVVMYEYLTGRVPFPYDKNLSKTEAEFKLLKAHLEQTPPPIEDLRRAYYEAKYSGLAYEKDYPDWLEEAVMRCLEKDPLKRFRNGKELYEFIVAHRSESTTIHLEEEIKNLKESCDELASAVQRLKAENETLTRQLDGEQRRKESYDELVSEVQRLKLENETLTGRLNDAQEQKKEEIDETVSEAQEPKGENDMPLEQSNTEYVPKICKRCGTIAISIDAKRCRKCGRKLE